MRRNQVSIKVERFGEDASDNKHDIIEVYADSNNIWEALAAANNLVTKEITNSTELPSFGATSIEVSH